MRDDEGDFVVLRDQFIRKTEQSQMFMHLKSELWNTESISLYISCWQKESEENTRNNYNHTFINLDKMRTFFWKTLMGWSVCPSNLYVETLTPRTSECSVCGDRVSSEVTRVKWGVCSGVCSSSLFWVLTTREGWDTDTGGQACTPGLFPAICVCPGSRGWPSAREGPPEKPTLSAPSPETSSLQNLS